MSKPIGVRYFVKDLSGPAMSEIEEVLNLRGCV